MKKFSYCVAVYNEEKYVKQGLKIISHGLLEILGKNNYEVVVVENGSTDQTLNIIKSLHYPRVNYYHTKIKGLGCAQRIAIKKAKMPYLEINAIDLPFHWDDLKTALPLLDHYDMVIGSKAHPQSKIKRSFSRQFSSQIYHLLLRLFFNLKVKDPQGAIFAKKTTLLKLLPYCQSNNAFFTTQLVIYAAIFKIKIIEIPITYYDTEKKSKYNPLKDGAAMFRACLSEYIKIKLSSINLYTHHKF